MEPVKAQFCLECESLNLSRKDFEQSRNDKPTPSLDVRSGTFAQLKSSALTCDLCRLVLHAYSRTLRNDRVAFQDETEWKLCWCWSTFGYSLRPPSFHEGGSALFPELKDQFTNRDHGIFLIDGQDTKKILRAREIPPEIDVEMLKGWVETCHEDHYGMCGEFGKASIGIGPPPEQLRCINVTKHCLEYISMEKEYVALSYVWGQNNRPLTTTANFHKFSVPGAFLDVRLPQTIADAMEVTNKLGYEYLWVDSLCIIQDHTQEVAHLIKQMSGIFGHADLTIIAASGTSVQAGLSGWGPTARNLRTTKPCNIGQDLRVGVLPNFNIELLESPYSSRGWTYVALQYSHAVINASLT